jgi:hypothetical protein
MLIFRRSKLYFTASGMSLFVSGRAVHQLRVVIKTNLKFSNLFFENRAVYEIRWKNTAKPGRPKMVIWRVRIACRIPKATNTLSE